MEDTQKNDFDINGLQEQVNIIYRCLYLNHLNESLIIALQNFIAIYIKAYEQYTNLEAPNEQVRLIYETLTGPINEAYNEHNKDLHDGMPHPAIEIIKDKLDEYHSSLEQNFTRTLAKNGIKFYEDDTISKNGFVFQFAIVGSTIILGIILGYILLLIR